MEWNNAPLAIRVGFLVTNGVIVAQTVIFALALYRFW